MVQRQKIKIFIIFKINIYKLDNYNHKINFTKYELNKLPEFKEKIKKIEKEKNFILKMT